MDAEKAIKKLFEAHGDLLEEIRELKKRIIQIEDRLQSLESNTFRARFISKEAEKMGRYKKENCVYLNNNGNCNIWFYPETKTKVAPSLDMCAFCPFFKARR